MKTNKREKTVWPNNDMLCHVFVQQTREYGRCGNMYFSGNTLYSYGGHYPLMHLPKPGVALVNSNRYSNTTAKHRSSALSALKDDVRVFHVPHPSNPGNPENLEYRRSAAHAFH